MLFLTAYPLKGGQGLELMFERQSITCHVIIWQSQSKTANSKLVFKVDQMFY